MRRQAARRAGRLGRHLLRSRSCTPTTTRRCGTSSRATCRTRMSLKTVASAGLAGAAQPGAVGERGEVRRRRHVRQGLRGQVDQGRHRRRRRRSSSRSTRRRRRMAVRSVAPARRAPARPAARASRRWLEREGVFSWLMLAPPACSSCWRWSAIPFFYGIWLSLQDRPVAKPGAFVGLGNFVDRCARPGVLAGRAQHLRLHRRRRRS